MTDPLIVTVTQEVVGVSTSVERFEINMGTGGPQGLQGPPGDVSSEQLIDEYGWVPVKNLDPVNDNSALLSNLAAALEPGQTMVLPIGSWLGDITLPSSGGVGVKGVRNPRYDPGAGRLVEGSILRGRIFMNGMKGTPIGDMGFDLVGLATSDCIVDGGATLSDTERHHTLDNLTMLGRGLDTFHAASLEHGSNHNITRIKMYKCVHGIAVRCKRFNIANIYAEDCNQSGIVVKSAASSGDAGQGNITNYVGRNLGLNQSRVLFYAEEAGTKLEHVNLSNAIVMDASFSAYQIQRVAGAGVCQDISLSNCKAVWSTPTSGTKAFRVLGDCADIDMVNVSARGAGISFANDGPGYGAGLRVRNGRSSLPADGHISGQWDVLEVNRTDKGNAAAMGLRRVTVGQEVYPRELHQVNVSLTSQTLRLGYFRCDRAESWTTMQFDTAATPAAATPTLIRYGLWIVNLDGSLTLVASTPNDTTLLAAANTQYSKAFSAAYSSIPGRDYAAGCLVVTSVNPPTVTGGAQLGPALTSAIDPRIAAIVASQSDLPATVAAGNVFASTLRPWALVKP